LSKTITEFDNRLQSSKELNKLITEIDKSNRELRMDFKREHKYNTAIYEEQLYKEVVYDTRKEAAEEESFKYMNPLKKSGAGSPTMIRN